MLTSSLLMLSNVYLAKPGAYFGASGVRLLPVGAAEERSVHYFCDSFSFFSSVPDTRASAQPPT